VRLPIPVWMIALSGALTVFSVLAGPRTVRFGAGRAPRTASAVEARLHIQAAEEQPAALTYFRIMDWLVRFLSSEPDKAAGAPASAPAAPIANAPGRSRSTPVRLCSLRVRANSSRGVAVSAASVRPILVSVSTED
jgi:hypothetical protein